MCWILCNRLLTDQISHVKRQLALLLSCESGAGDARSPSRAGGCLATTSRRRWIHALGALYRPIWGEALSPALTPRLQDLCDRLEALATPAGHMVAGGGAPDLRHGHEGGQLQSGRQIWTCASTGPAQSST